MLVLTVSQLVESSEGSVPESFKGTIKKVWPQSPCKRPNAKQGEPTEGTLQKLILTDGSAEIEVMLSDREAVPRTMEGKGIHCIASHGARGLTGMKRKSNTYKGTTTPQVWVYDSAEVVFEGGGSSRTTPPPQQSQQSQQQRQPTSQPGEHTNGSAQRPAPTAGSKGSSPADRAGAIKEFNRRLARATSAYERCFDGAAAMARRLDERLRDLGGFKPSADTIEKMAACLMVQACWNQKPADIDAFPIREFSAYDDEGNLKSNGHHPPAQDPAHQRNGAPFTT